MVHIHNEHLSVTIDPQGAYLVSVVDKAKDYEFLWNQAEAPLAQQGTVYFPNIQGGSGQTYTYQGETYTYYPFGFARDRQFHLQTQTESSATFYLKNQSGDEQFYPFAFSFQVTYILHHNKITVSYEILNQSSEKIYYSLGTNLALKVSPAEVRSDFDELFLDLMPSGQHLRIPYKDSIIDISKSKYELVYHLLLMHKYFNTPLLYQLNQRTEITLLESNGAQVHLQPNNFGFLNLTTNYPEFKPYLGVELFAGTPEERDNPDDLASKYGIQAIEPHQLGLHDCTMTFIKK